MTRYSLLLSFFPFPMLVMYTVFISTNNLKRENKVLYVSWHARQFLTSIGRTWLNTNVLKLLNGDWKGGEGNSRALAS